VENVVVTLTQALTNKTLASLKWSDLKLSDGNDTLTVSGDVENSDISLGGGANALTVNGELIDSEVNLSGTSNTVTLADDVNYTVINASGASNESKDEIILSAGKTFSTGEINLGEGNNSLSAAGRIENTAVSAGAGNDAVSLHEAENVTVSLGAGENSFEIGGAYEKLSVSGAGATSVTVSGADGETREDLLIELGAGDDAVTVGGSATSDHLALDRAEIALGQGNNELELYLKKLGTTEAESTGVVLTGRIGYGTRVEDNEVIVYKTKAIIDFEESGDPANSRAFLSIGELGAGTLVNGLNVDFGSGQNVLNMAGNLAVQDSEFSFDNDSVNSVTISGENMIFGGYEDDDPLKPLDPAKNFVLDLNYSDTALLFEHTGDAPTDGITFKNIGSG
jgi:hypothetical protein